MIDPALQDSGVGGDLKRTKAGAALDRLPPHAPEMERGVLGCILVSPNDCLDEACERIKNSKAFYDLRHQAIFDTASAMHTAREPIDLITLPQRLKDRDLLNQVGGLAYLAQLRDAVPSAANLAYYLDVVMEKWLLRQWVALCTGVVGRIYEYEGDVAALTGEVSRQVFELCERDTPQTARPLRELLVDVNAEYLEKFQRGVKRKVGLQTGFNYMDNIMPGMEPGDLVVIAARPSMGKSAILMQIIEHVCECEGPAAIISLEMSGRSLAARELFQKAGADMTKFLNGFMSNADVQKLTNALTELSKLPLHIDDAPRLSIEDLEIRVRRLVRQHGLKVVGIDYFQLLFVRNRHKQWSKADELAEVSKRLKALAKECGIPIILLSQMNREIEKEKDRRPRLSDLRDTGQLEQDADKIMFLWMPDTSPDIWEKRIDEIVARLEVPAEWKKNWKKNLRILMWTMEKQREGRSGEDALMVFIKPWTRFVDAYTPAKTAKPAQSQETSGEEKPEPLSLQEEEWARMDLEQEREQ